MFRTDSHNNPTAFTVDLAREAGLTLGVDYAIGDKFQAGGLTLYTAIILGDAAAITIRLIDKVGFYTRNGLQRWSYIAIPAAVWASLSDTMKAGVIGGMYRREGGTEMRDKFLSAIPF